MFNSFFPSIISIISHKTLKISTFPPCYPFKNDLRSPFSRLFLSKFLEEPLRPLGSDQIVESSNDHKEHYNLEKACLFPPISTVYRSSDDDIQSQVPLVFVALLLQLQILVEWKLNWFRSTQKGIYIEGGDIRLAEGLPTAAGLDVGSIGTEQRLVGVVVVMGVRVSSITTEIDSFLVFDLFYLTN